MMAALFSCTKCHKRYPFDELSQGEQLCKECRNNFPTVKCTYCRAEFQQNSRGSTSSICAKCAQNVKHYGKPTACENCSVLAAFIGNRCQRCVNSEKKWGRPLVCEQCKLKCAFDRPERRKQDGKLMCWLCDQAYKRVLAKTRKSQELILKTSKSSSSFVADSPNKSNTPTNHDQNFPSSQTVVSSGSLEGMTVLERLTRLATSGGSSRGNTPPVNSDRKFDNVVLGKPEAENRVAEKESSSAVLEEKDDGDDKEKHRSHRHHRKHHHHHHHRSHHSKRRHSKDEDDSGDAKKQKAEKNSANGVTAAAVSTPKSTGSNEAGADTATSENVILITQLREQIESLKKLMNGKDQQLLEKDKKITELKAQMYELDKDFRAKNQASIRSHATSIENLQIKNRELTRQVASLSKGKKTSDTSSLNLST
ncbi:protein FAM76B [Aplysia californica]|uniref:Protein FAM76B n=1 Tax=Aplysia californica TaxID=6500 RepID=A0ABM0JMG9_APLCA|nr:protein FAM76B [Aplysia californica]